MSDNENYEYKAKKYYSKIRIKLQRDYIDKNIPVPDKYKPYLLDFNRCMEIISKNQ